MKDELKLVNATPAASYAGLRTSISMSDRLMPQPARGAKVCLRIETSEGQ